MPSRRARRHSQIIATWVAAGLVAAGVVGFTSFALNAKTPTAVETAFVPKPIVKAFVPTLLVMGDSFTGGSNEGGFRENGWPALVQSAYVKDGARLQLNLLGRGGAGYLTPGQIKETFGQSYSGNAFKDQDVIVVFGGLNDSDKPAAKVGAAAAALYGAMMKNSPKAKLIVVGPAWPTTDPVPNIFEVRDAIKAAAAGADATFIDPLTDGWFLGEAAILIGQDKTHPTDAGHKYMADKLSPSVMAAVKQAAVENK